MVKKVSTVLIALTSAVAIDGEICVAGSQVEVDHDLAKDLLNRGRGTLVEVSEEQAVNIEAEEIDLTKLKKPQLVELATEYGIEDPESFTIAQLIEKITEANDAEGAE